MSRNLLAATLALALFASTAHAAPDSNQELAAITAQDQADRQPGPNKIDWSVVNQRDEHRRIRVLQILKEGNVRTDTDYYNAALVFQHGATADDIRLAHSLSQTAQQINPQNKAAIWLSAASWDRLMMRLNQPQWYATQFVKQEGRWVLYQVNEAVVGDDERVKVGARTLKAAREHAEALNAR
jgi:hypothetical protein